MQDYKWLFTLIYKLAKKSFNSEFTEDGYADTPIIAS